jgi:hypothetical protein
MAARPYTDVTASVETYINPTAGAWRSSRRQDHREAIGEATATPNG